MRKLLGLALAAAAAGAVKMAAKVAPQRQVDVFTHRMHAKGRRWWHLDAYRAQPGYLYIEVGGGTMEVAWKTRGELPA